MGPGDPSAVRAGQIAAGYGNRCSRIRRVRRWRPHKARAHRRQTPPQRSGPRRAATIPTSADEQGFRTAMVRLPSRPSLWEWSTTAASYARTTACVTFRPAFAAVSPIRVHRNLRATSSLPRSVIDYTSRDAGARILARLWRFLPRFGLPRHGSGLLPQGTDGFSQGGRQFTVARVDGRQICQFLGLLQILEHAPGMRGTVLLDCETVLRDDRSGMPVIHGGALRRDPGARLERLARGSKIALAQRFVRSLEL